MDVQATRPTLRVIFAFLHGVALGIFWEGISMGVLVAATLVEHACGELAMVGVFWGAACAMYYISHRVDLLWPLLGILLFRLSAQLATSVVRSTEPVEQCTGEKRGIPSPIGCHEGEVPDA